MEKDHTQPDAPPARPTFERARRLLSGRDYSAVLGHGKRLRSETLTVVCLPSTQARLGIAVPKKQIRRAVNRNRVKRILRESFRLRASTLPAYDLVVLCRAGAIDSVRLRQDFASALDRLNRLTWQPRPTAHQSPQTQDP